MGHVRIGPGPVPMVLPGQNLNHVAHADVQFLGLVGDNAVAQGDDQDLVAGMRVPAGGGALFKLTTLLLKNSLAPSGSRGCRVR